jgi:paraquat-inducible protein B
MSKRSNPALIGAFVLGALALVTLAIAVFGGSALFARTGMLVTYFDGSVKGLREGSSVVFRGVRVGFVQNIALLTDVETLTPKIEVTMELLPDSIKVLRDGRTIEGSLDSVVSVDELVDAGFSAQLGSESFVTGQLLVELDFRPDRNLQLYGTRTPYPEIPSVPSEIQQAILRFQTMLSNIEQNVDLATLSERVLSVLQGLDELANSRELRDAIAGLERLVNAPEAQRLAASLDGTMGELAEAARRAGQLIANVDGDIDLLTGRLGPAAERFTTLLDQAEETLQAVRRQAAGDTPQMYQLQSTLAEVEEAAQTLRAFFDYLERHPNALLRGKQP